MHITVGTNLELDVGSAATAADIARFARGHGVELDGKLWCGAVALDPDHPAGAWPLIHGARLAGTPGEPTAPPRGPVLLAVSGPDSGRIFGAGDGGVGRATELGRGVADPRLSRTHLELTADPHLACRDAGSLNGSWHVRGGVRKRLGRPRRLEPGDRIEAGRTGFVVVDVADGAETEAQAVSPAAGLGARVAPLAASAGGGVMMAALTGRWWFLLIGLAYPAIALGPEFARRLRSGRTPAAPPSPLDPHAEDVGWEGDTCIAGAPEAAAGFARALVLGRGRRPPQGSWVEPWMGHLPPAAPGDGKVRLDAAGAGASWDDGVATVGEGGVVWERAGTTRGVAPAHVSRAVADACARRIAGRSQDEPLPSAVTWGDVRPAPATLHRPGLKAPIGMSAQGPFQLDLDAHGPHILVAGTTGSGKSALLETLVLGIARQYSPADVAVALLDFKGGAGLASCRSLPHVAGVLTDLEPHLARRALAALARELTARKEGLARAGFASVADWERSGGAPPRLLVVADEYQELAAGYPEFLPDLARLAAQGRSLGLHLVLATQRPSGAVTPEIRANVGTTIALRVASEAESRDLIGTPAAAALGTDRPGRAIVATGQQRIEVQCALPTQLPSPPIAVRGLALDLPDATDFAASAIVGPPPPPLWQEPLPVALEADDPRLAAGEEGRAVFGLWDEPATRTQGAAAWRPAAGSLAVVGPPGSGRTGALRAVAAGAARAGMTPVWLPQDPREAARTLTLAAALPDAVLVIDDAQEALVRLTEHARGTAGEALVRSVGAGRAVLAVGAGAPSRLTSACTAKLVLGALDSAEAAAWGVPRPLAAVPDAPGRGRLGVGPTWREVQVARAGEQPPAPLVAALPATVEPDPTGRRLGVGGDDAAPWMPPPGRPVIVIGDPCRERDAIVQALASANPDCRGADSPFAVPARERDEALLVVTRPVEAGLRELAPESLAEFVDAAPPPLRVVVLDGREASVVQLAEPRDG